MKTCLKLKKRVSLYVSFFLIAGLATLQSVCFGAVNMPAFDSLAPLATTVEAPADVAIDQQGRTYVAETNEDRVTILSQSGNLIARLGVTAPISIAVDAGGRILVGGRDNGKVTIYGSDLAPAGELGAGDGEFGKPMDIAVDSSGSIYVVDKTNHAIGVYNSSGDKTGSIGSPGNGDGQLNHPISIAIDETAGEIVVLDLQQVYDNNTRKMIDGARIQYFDMNGLSLRAYSKFGYNNAGQDWNNGGVTIYDITMGQITRPKQIAVDDYSRIYVSDARLQQVMVYDNTDGFLGTLDNATSPFRIPMGLAIGDSGRLYVASLFTKKVEVFGVDQYTAMVVTPQNIEFNVVENGDAPDAQQIDITNQGNTPIIFTTESQDAWVADAATTNTLIAGETASISITVDPAGLAPGVHTASVVVDTGAGAVEIIDVKITVDKKPTNPLQVNKESLIFETPAGTTPGFEQLLVESTILGLWTATVDQPTMISLNKTTDTGNPASTVKVYADISSLDVGTHDAGFITFTQDGASDVRVAVEITITDSDKPVDDLPVLGDDGNMWNKKWSVSQKKLSGGANLNGVSGSSEFDVFAVGDDGAIIHFDGKEWTAEDPVLTNNALNSVWSSSETDVNAVGTEGLVLNFDGTWAEAVSSGSDTLQDIWVDTYGNIVTVNKFGDIDGLIVESTEVALRTLWGTTADTVSVGSDLYDNVYVAGEAGAVFNYDGSTLTKITPETDSLESVNDDWINGIWANSSTDVFAVGENGTIVHYDGTTWTAMDSGVNANLNGICGTSATDVYAVGNNSVILYYNGDYWTAMDAGAVVNLNDVWCSGKKDIIAVGDDGTVIKGKAVKNFDELIQ